MRYISYEYIVLDTAIGTMRASWFILEHVHNNQTILKACDLASISRHFLIGISKLAHRESVPCVQHLRAGHDALIDNNLPSPHQVSHFTIYLYSLSLIYYFLQIQLPTTDGMTLAGPA